LLKYYEQIFRIITFFKWLGNIQPKSKPDIMNAQRNDGRIRKNIQIGDEVDIVQKKHQQTGELTDGIVKRILTNSPTHPHGIKVQLETGEVGRVKMIYPEE